MKLLKPERQSTQAVRRGCTVETSFIFLLKILLGRVIGFLSIIKIWLKEKYLPKMISGLHLWTNTLLPQGMGWVEWMNTGNISGNIRDLPVEQFGIGFHRE